MEELDCSDVTLELVVSGVLAIFFLNDTATTEIYTLSLHDALPILSFDPSVAAYQSLGVGQQTVLTVPYTVTDDQGATSTADLVITVTGTNDAPVIDVNATAVVSETGLPNGIPLPGMTNVATVNGQYQFHDADSGATFTFTLTAPVDPLTSGGQ